MVLAVASTYNFVDHYHHSLSVDTTDIGIKGIPKHWETGYGFFVFTVSVHGKNIS